MGTSILSQFEFAYFFVLIQNPDPEENQSYSQLLPLTFYSNSPAFIEIAMAHGLDVVLTPNFGPVSRTPITDASDLTSYVFPSDTKHFEFVGRAIHDGEATAEWYDALYYENQGGLRRIFQHRQGINLGSTEGTMRFGPTSYWAEHSSVDQVQDLLNFHNQTTVEFNFDPDWVG